MRKLLWVLGLLVLVFPASAQLDTANVFEQLDGTWEAGSSGVGAYNEEVVLLFNDIQVGKKSGTFRGKNALLDIQYALLICESAAEDRFLFRIDYQIFQNLKASAAYHPSEQHKYLLVTREVKKNGKEIVRVALLPEKEYDYPAFSRIRRKN